MNLYQIENEYLQLSEMLIDSEGELTPELIEALEINGNNLKNKAVNYGYVIKQMEGNVDLIDAEIKRLQAMKKSRVNAADTLKETIKTAMLMYDLNTIEIPTMKLSFRKSESIEIINEAQLSEDFTTTKVTTTPNKVAIKEALKNGVEVAGAVMVTNLNLQIK